MMNHKIKMSSNRSFGIVFFVFFLILSIYPLLFNKSEVKILFLFISLIFLILGLLNSKFLSPLNKAWFKFGILLGSFISPIIMSVIFFLVVTPISLLLKILGKDILSIKKKNIESYWVEKSGPKSKMKNQF